MEKTKFKKPNKSQIQLHVHGFEKSYLDYLQELDLYAMKLKEFRKTYDKPKAKKLAGLPKPKTQRSPNRSLSCC